jgi:PPM family protein phosphatase
MNDDSCFNCGDPVEPDDKFCESCGQRLGVRRTPKGGPTEASQTCAGCGSTTFEDGFCAQCGWEQPSPRDRMEADLGAVAGITDKGRRRARNEDSMAFGVTKNAAGEPVVVAVVCDGVATSDRADNASQLAVDEATDVLLDAVLAGTDAETATKSAVARAIEVVSALADPTVPGTAPSCTYVSAVVGPASVTVGWVGDSRIYWLADGDDSDLLTIDDTVATELVAEGMPEAEALAVHQAHALSKWIGADAGDVEPRVTTLEPAGPGAVLLCSDGLWNYLPEPEALRDALPGAPSETELIPAAAELTRQALELGGHDNITTVLVPYRPGSTAEESDTDD